MITTLILTAPRKDANYLPISLDSYLQCFGVKPHIFAEPGSPKPYHLKHVVWHQNTSEHGLVHNWLAAARYALKYLAGDYVMICEDDILWATDAAIRTRGPILTGWMCNRPLHTVGFFSPYCSRVNSRALVNDSWGLIRNEDNWCGNLALVFPRDSLKLITESGDEIIKLTTTETGFHMYMDYAIAMFLHQRGYQMYAHMPTLVSHLGEVSTLACNNTETARKSPTRQPAL